MKKSISFLFCLVMLLSVMTGCGNSGKNDVNTGDTDNGRPTVTDNVGQDNGGSGNYDTGVVDPNTSPTVTDLPVTDRAETDMSRVGDDVRRGMDNVGDAVKDAADDLMK